MKQNDNAYQQKQVGIFAGTFDPVHDGHLAFAREALASCNLDKVFFLVEPRPRRKQGVRALEHRVNMVRLAIADERRFSNIILEQTNFSVVDTLPKLQALFAGAELHLLMGDDVVRHLAEWPHVKRLIEAVHFIIGAREDGQKAVEQHLRTLQKTRGITFKYNLFEPSKSEYASSKIRSALRRGQVPGGLRPAVSDYIRENGLYSLLTKE